MGHSAEREAGPWIGDTSATYTRDGRAISDNGRPLDTHDRHLTSDYAQQLHTEHVGLYGALCATCGCCWCCDDDCCAEYVCPNADCGCSDKPAPTRLTPPTEPGADRAGGEQ